MSIWLTLVLVVHVLAALGIVGLVLLQHGKGADVGAAFGSGASGSLFGATGSANFLSRTTAVLAIIFFATTFALAFLASNRPRATSSALDVIKEQPAPPAPSAPASSGAPPAAPKAPETPANSKANEVPK